MPDLGVYEGTCFLQLDRTATEVAALALPALVVDMDGTLVRSDTLYDAVVTLVGRDPGVLLHLPLWVSRGKVALKLAVADRCILDAEGLPYDDAVLEMIRKARAEGRQVALVSASDHRQVRAVADYLGLFDLAIGTGSPDTAGVNLAGPQKARFLAERYGAKGFDYIGDSQADLAVWAEARQAIVVRRSLTLQREAESQGLTLTPLGTGGRSLMPLLRAMRPHQWSKNLLILLPVMASHRLEMLGPALLAMLIFSLVASSVYLLNDLADLGTDRAHARKRHRPFASGTLSVTWGLTAVGVLIGTAAVLAFTLATLAFLKVLAFYFLATFAYSFWLKRKLLVDIIALAGLYTVRIFAGGAATGIVLSEWLLAFSMFLFFSLAAIKRQAELVDMQKSGRKSTPGRGYLTDDLPVLRAMAVASGQAAVLVFALYVNSPATVILYTHQEAMWLICFILFFWLSRMEMMTHRGLMNDDPIVFAMRDRTSLGCLVAVAGLVVLAGSGG